MKARFSTPCICGARVNPGDEIAFCSELRRVTMCPSCAPKKTHRVGRFVDCGAGLCVASIRHMGTGRVDAVVFRELAPDSNQGTARYAKKDGRWSLHSAGGNVMDAPTYLTDAMVRERLAEAARRFHEAKAAA